MGLIKEFREFAIKGNMIDMAVGLIIGAAFGGVVKSLVDQVMMPPLGVLIGNMDFSDMRLELRPPRVDESGAEIPGAYLQYGAFITTLINFLIVAFAVFLVVKAINTARRRFEQQAPPPAPPGPTLEETLLTEIRDLLARRA